MKDWIQIEEVLNKQNFSVNDQKLIKNFLLSFDFLKRQQLMGIFLGFPEQISLFIDLIKKKVEFAKNPTEILAKDIFDIESRKIQDLIKKLE